MINLKYFVGFILMSALSIKGYCQKTDLYVDLVNPTNKTVRNTSDSVKGYAESGGIPWLHFGVYSDYYFEGKFPISFEWNGSEDNHMAPLRIIKKRELKKIKMVNTDYLLQLLGKLGYSYNRSYRLFFVEPYKRNRYSIIQVRFTGDLSNNDVFSH